MTVSRQHMITQCCNRLRLDFCSAQKSSNVNEAVSLLMLCTFCHPDHLTTVRRGGGGVGSTNGIEPDMIAKIVVLHQQCIRRSTEIHPPPLLLSRDAALEETTYALMQGLRLRVI